MECLLLLLLLLLPMLLLLLTGGRRHLRPPGMSHLVTAVIMIPDWISMHFREYIAHANNF
jgi:hypothetical protein